MSLNWIATTCYWYIEAIFWNFLPKAILALVTSFISYIYAPNALYINAIMLIYLIDLILWIIKAIKYGIWSSSAFIRWAFKIIVYWILISLWFFIDLVLHTWWLVLWSIMVFIVLTDAWSILENIEEIWYPVPEALKQLLKVHKDKFFYEKIKNYTWFDIKNRFENDLKQMTDIYIPLIKDKSVRKMFEVKIRHLITLILDIDRDNIDNCKVFKVKLGLMLNVTWQSIESDLRKRWFKNTEIKPFLDRHNKRVDELLEEIKHITNDYTECSTEQERKQRKDNILQAIIRIVYKWISDNINAK